MFIRIVQGARTIARHDAFHHSPVAVFLRNAARGLKSTVHHTFMILGVAAIGTIALMFVRPEITDHLKALSPFAVANAGEAPRNGAAMATAGSADVGADAGSHAPADRFALGATVPSDKTSAATQRQQALVTSWLSKKYRVATDATDMLVSAAYGTARDIKLDPLLILSVMAIESGFNPFAESPVGAQGLMQVMSKVHHDKFQQLGGVKAALNPVANIRVGSLILKDYVTRGGSVEAGLKQYVGAAAFDTDFGYGSKVLAEYRRLKDVAVGKQVPTSAPAYVAKAKPVEHAADTPAVLATPAPVSNAAVSKSDAAVADTNTVAAL
jgi:soluble lytic murein transglycosylase-like protein